MSFEQFVRIPVERVGAKFAPLAFAPAMETWVVPPAADALAAEGIPVHRIRVSLERNMRCGAAWCGHCQLGPLLICRDGAVFRQDRVAALMEVAQL